MTANYKRKKESKFLRSDSLELKSLQVHCTAHIHELVVYMLCVNISGSIF